jgi:hypothetical protein
VTTLKKRNWESLHTRCSAQTSRSLIGIVGRDDDLTKIYVVDLELNKCTRHRILVVSSSQEWMGEQIEAPQIANECESEDDLDNDPSRE